MIMFKQSSSIAFATAISGMVFGIVVGFSPASALTPDAGETDRLKACEKSFCEAVVKKGAGADLACGLSKTWMKSFIKEGVEKKKLSWSYGDARCTLDVKLGRATVVDALSKPEHVLDFGQNVVKCVIENDKEMIPINITMAPKITFKDGKATKAIIGVKEIEAPAVVKGALWTVATVEDNIGIFHNDMLKNINEFIGPKCAEAVK